LLSDPLTITYSGSGKSLARLSYGADSSRYASSDGQFVMEITTYPKPREAANLVGIKLTRLAPDPTPSDVFDPYRDVRNSIELRFETDISRFEASTVIPLLRTALDSFVDSTMLNRLIGGEK
jgi:hypothetical protein